MTPDFEFNVNDLIQILSDGDVSVGVVAEGDAAAYAEVWEWGNARQTKPGPKTVLGTNPDGQMVWLSIQAPFGYIHINEPFFWRIIDEELQKVDLNQPNKAALQKEFETHARVIASAMADVIKDSAPVDTGQLRDSIKPVEPGDSILATADDSSGVLIL